MRTFKCDFGNGVSCQIEVPDVAPQKGTSHIEKVEWIGKVTPSVVRPYIRWMNSVNKLLCDEWGLSLMHIFQTSPRWTEWETWVYAPGKAPRRVRER